MKKAASKLTKLNQINNFCVCLIFLCLILGETVRFTVSGLGSIRALDILVLFTVLTSLPEVLKNPPRSYLVRFFLIFLCFNVFSLTVSYFTIGSGVLIGIVHFSRLILYFSLYPSIKIFIQNNSRTKLIRLIVFVVGTISALGLMQLLFVPDIGFLAKYGWDPHRNRLVSTWLDPNFLAPVIVIGLGMLISDLDRKLPNSIKKSQIALLFLLTISIVLTFSRSGYIAAIVFLGLFGLKYARKLVFVLLITAVLATVLVSPIRDRLQGIINPDTTASARLVSWVESVEIFKNTPIIGVGYNNYSYYKNQNLEIEQKNSSFGADSSILLILSTTGIVGTILFFVPIIYSILKNLLSGKRKKYIYASILTGLLLASNFNNLIFYPLIIPPLLTLIAFIDESN